MIINIILHVVSSRVTFTVEFHLSLMGLNIKMQFEHKQLGRNLGGALCVAWSPSPAALVKGLFCLWIGPFFCPERKNGALSSQCTIDNYRTVLNCYFFLRHKRPIGVLILAKDRLSSLWSSAPITAWVSSAKIGFCRHPAHSELSDYISWKRKSFLHLAQPKYLSPEDIPLKLMDTLNEHV